MSTNTSELSIVIPCYNEADSLPSFLPDLVKFAKSNDFQIIIVNDASKDNSLHLLKEYEHLPFFTICNHKVNRGYGGALKTGIASCQTKYLITIDSDGQHQFSDVLSLFEEIKSMSADMIVGSRKGAKGQSKFRAVGKWLIRSIAKKLMPLNIYDINSGMKIYRTCLATKYLKLLPDTMAFSDIITLTFVSNKHLVLEKPITILDRVGGKSTITVRTAFVTVMEILNIIVLFNPLKIFLNLSWLFLFFGVMWGLPIIIQGRGVSVGAMLLIITGLIFFALGLMTEQLTNIRKGLVEN